MSVGGHPQDFRTAHFDLSADSTWEDQADDGLDPRVLDRAESGVPVPATDYRSG